MASRSTVGIIKQQSATTTLLLVLTLKKHSTKMEFSIHNQDDDQKLKNEPLTSFAFLDWDA